MELRLEMAQYVRCSSNISRSDGAQTILCTLVTPLRNELDSIEELWCSIQTQSILPGEWIIVDNGSADGTYEWLVNKTETSLFPVTVLSLPGKNIAMMMNAAIELARHDIIACCHGGTQIPVNWLESLLKPIKEDPSVDVVAGVWKAYGKTSFERWLAKAPPYALNIDVLNENSYLPAARSMLFRRDAWKKVEGFPEWLPMFGEDTLFDIRLHAAGCRFSIAQEALVGWRPKDSVLSTMRQWYLYYQADACIGLQGYATPKVLLRPWMFILPAGMVGMFLSWGFGASVLLLLAVADHIRRVVFYHRTSISEYFFWLYLMPLAMQTGAMHGWILRLLGRVTVPEADLRSVREYQHVLKNN